MAVLCCAVSGHAVSCCAVLCYAVPGLAVLCNCHRTHQRCNLTCTLCLQDPVPKVGKFGVLYARPGQRVILDAGGEMQVRPTQLDMRLSTLNPCKKMN